MARKKQPKSNPIENLKGAGFHRNPENINRTGQNRKSQLVHEINDELKAIGYIPITETQIIEIYNIMLQLPKDEIDKMAADPEKPYYINRVAEFIKGNRGMEMMDRILDRSFGRVVMRQSVDAVLKTEQPLFGNQTE